MKYQSHQLYNECQLVAVINAAIHLGESPVTVGSPEYERLVDLVDARKDGAYHIEKAVDYLRLRMKRQSCNLWRIKTWLKEGFPIGINVDLPDEPHAATIVAYRKKGNEPELKVPNLNYKENRYGWIKWKDLKEVISLKGYNFGFVSTHGKPVSYMWIFSRDTKKMSGGNKKDSRKNRSSQRETVL